MSKIGRKIAFVKMDDPAKPTSDKYQPLESIGSAVYDIVFESDKFGLKAYLITCFQNARGEAGPESIPLEFLVI